MLLHEPVYLLRHGQVDTNTGELSGAGFEQAERACDDLLEAGLGETALILSSSAERAVRTAQIIQKGLGCAMVSSSYLARVGNHPATIKDLDKTLLDQIFLSGTEPSAIKGLVVVAHGPLIAAAQGIWQWSNEQQLNQAAPYAGVISYQPGSWRSPGN